MVSNGMSHSCPSVQRKRRVVISKLPPSILMAFPFSRASASFRRADSSTRWKVGREMLILSAACSCSRPSRSLSRMASASSTEMMTSSSTRSGIPAGLKCVTAGIKPTRRYFLGLGNDAISLYYEHTLIIIVALNSLPVNILSCLVKPEKVTCAPVESLTSLTARSIINTLIYIM